MVNLSSINPGSYLQIVPVGLVGTLVYSDKGILTEFVKLDGTSLDPQLTVYLEKEGILPQRIMLTANQTKVFGVIYTPQRFNAEGHIPECYEESFIKDIKKNPQLYKFYAVNIENPMLKFSGGVSKQNRLRTLQFEPITGFSVIEVLDERGLETTINSTTFPFPYPVISGMFVTNLKGESTYIPQDLEQHIVKKVDSHIDENGFIRADLKLNNDEELTTSYTDVVRFSIQPKMSIITGGSRIIHSYPLPNSKIDNVIKCSVCGKQLVVPKFGVVSCSDPHCRSKIYNDVNHLLNTLHLDTLSYEDFKKYTHSKKLNKVSDIFNIDPYTQEIECSLRDLVRGAIPIQVCSNNQFIDDLVLGTSSLSGLSYYLHNPTALSTDLTLDRVALGKFSLWLMDTYNVEMLEDLLAKPNLKIIQKASKFEGAPIFRNKTICITGSFKHGTHSYISNVLQSYQANVVTQFSNKVDCVLVGDFRNEETEILNLARSYKLPIYIESDFFKAYQIDDDLSSLDS